MCLDDGSGVDGVGYFFAQGVAKGEPDVKVLTYHLWRYVGGIGSGVALGGIFNEGGEGLVFCSNQDLCPIGFTVGLPAELSCQVTVRVSGVGRLRVRGTAASKVPLEKEMAGY